MEKNRSRNRVPPPSQSMANNSMKIIKKRPLQDNEDFMEYKFVEMEDGTIKRKKIIKSTTKKIKYITDE